VVSEIGETTTVIQYHYIDDDDNDDDDDGDMMVMTMIHSYVQVIDAGKGYDIQGSQKR